MKKQLGVLPSDRQGAVGLTINVQALEGAVNKDTHCRGELIVLLSNARVLDGQFELVHRHLAVLLCVT
jgi:hypothetical protein